MEALKVPLEVLEHVYFTLFSDASVYTPSASEDAHAAPEPLSTIVAVSCYDTVSSTSGSVFEHPRLTNAVATSATRIDFVFMFSK